MYKPKRSIHLVRGVLVCKKQLLIYYRLERISEHWAKVLHKEACSNEFEEDYERCAQKNSFGCVTLSCRLLIISSDCRRKFPGKNERFRWA